MGSSAQNSSGVHWCRRRVRFNEVPEKVPKVPEKVWEALVQSQVTFNRVPEKVPEVFAEKLPEKVPGSLGAKPSQVQQGSGEGSGGFWCRYLVRFRKFPAQLPDEVPEGLGEDAWWGAGWGSGGFRCRDLVRFWRVLGEKMLGEVPEGSGVDTLWGSGGLWCRCFVNFQRVPMFLWHKRLISMA